jgi:predicted phage-related endonuclease
MGFGVPKEKNFIFSKGHEVEAFARGVISKKLGIDLKPAVYQSEKYPWAIASIDGADEATRTIVEIKYASHDDHETARNGQVPAHYVHQVQWQIFVTGCDHAIYASCHDSEIITLEVKRDNLLIDQMIGEAERFHNWMVTGEEPPLSESDYVQIDGNPEFETAAKSWIEIKKMADHYNAHLEKCKARLIELSDDGNCEGYGVRLTRVERAGNVQWKDMWEEIRKTHPEVFDMYNVENYKKPQIGYWKLTEIK